jgi:DNA-directed RNA polymerase subunit RPC12/RpoP
VKKLKEFRTFKFCSNCGEFKHVSEFYRDKGKRNGLAITCKSCRSKYSKEYYQENRERILDMAKDFQVEHYQKTKKSKLSGGSGPEYSCLECGKAFWGWPEDNTCPDCGEKLILAKKHKKIKL